ncbi:MAG: 2-C-methyl-D-erythritol 4-phosphate cytidylyltransferase, partial [Legionellaceae bacterium]
NSHIAFKDLNFTDDSALNEYAGIPVAIVPGSQNNFKITTQEDFERLLKREDVHLILSASDSRFHDFIPQVKNKLLLIDETHQHAYTAEQAKTLEEVCQNNATLGLTGTPTGHLFNAFKDHACVEFNLGNAMKAGLLRSLDYQDLTLSSRQTSDFVDAAILSYFNPVYLTSGDPGYRPPKKPPTLEDILKNFIPPNQKAMIFSDKQSVLIEIQNTLLSIENGTLEREKAAFYTATIRERRVEALKKQLDDNHVSYTEEELEAAIPPVDLHQELMRTRIKGIKNTVFSYALSILFKSEDRQKFSSLLRSHGLSESYLLAQAKYSPLKDPDDLERRIDKLVELNALPEPYLSELKSMIKNTTQALDDKMKENLPGTMDDVSRILHEDLSSPLKSTIHKILEENPSPTVITIQMESKDQDVKQHLAELKFGLASIALSDQRWATGVSIEDVLTSIIVNTRLNFQEHNAVCAPLGAAQAVGRAVRNKDLRGSATMISSADIPQELIYTVEQILALDSGEQSKKILAAWDKARDKYKEVYEENISQGQSPEQADELAYRAACDIVRHAVHEQLPPGVAEEIIPEEITLTQEGSVSGKSSNSGLFSTSIKREKQRTAQNEHKAPGDETPPPLTRPKTI